jgi:hypothetical protein
MRNGTQLGIALGMAFVIAIAPSAAYAGHAADVAGIVTQNDLDAALASQSRAEIRSRAAVHELLDREDVAEMAAGLRIDLRSAHDAIDTLQLDELERLAGLASEVDQVGGQNITMSLLAFLLVIIIVILLAR